MVVEIHMLQWSGMGVKRWMNGYHNWYTCSVSFDCHVMIVEITIKMYYQRWWISICIFILCRYALECDWMHVERRKSDGDAVKSLSGHDSSHFAFHVHITQWFMKYSWKAIALWLLYVNMWLVTGYNTLVCEYAWWIVEMEEEVG